MTPPILDRRTVEFLDTIVPERSPDPTKSEREIWMEAGKRELVRRLIAILEQQEEDAGVLGNHL